MLGVLELQYPEPLSSWRLMGCPMKSALKTEQALDFALPGLEKPIEGQGPQTPLVLEPSMLSGTHKTLFEEQAISENQRSCQALDHDMKMGYTQYNLFHLQDQNPVFVFFFFLVGFKTLGCGAKIPALYDAKNVKASETKRQKATKALFCY